MELFSIDNQPSSFISTTLPPAALALHDEVRAFFAQELAAGSFVPQCDAWIAGFSPAAEQGEATAAIAAAKIRVGEASGQATAIAHQVHGAMGYTYEYPLHFLSKRLWAWRDEFGSESEWARKLGQMVATQGTEALWPFLAS